MKVKGLQHGLYEIYWTSGGSSLAAVGYDVAGWCWMSPVNWTSGVTTEWKQVKAIKLLIKHDYTKAIKGIRGEGNKTLFNRDHFDITIEDEDV